MVFELINFDAFLCFCCFCFTFPHWQNVPFENFFHLGKQKWSPGEREISQVGEQGGWGTEAMPFFIKNSWTPRAAWAGAIINHPLWNGEMCWKSLKKISVGPHSAPPNNTSWYTDSNGFLEHSRSGGSLYYKGPSLQKVIQCFRYPLVYLALKSLQINVINIFIICRSFLLTFCNSSLPPFLPGVLHLGPRFPSL